MAKSSIKTVKTKILSQKILKEQIFKIIRTGVIAYLGLAVVAVILIGTQSTSVVMQYSTRDVIGESAIAAAERPIVTVEYRLALAVMLLVSAIGLILLSTRYLKTYQKSIKSGISGPRWIYLGSTWALLIATVALLFGISVFSTLELIVVLVLFGMLFAWITERETSRSKRPKWFGWLAGIVASALAWLPIVLTLLATWIFGSVSHHWYVYAAGLFALIGIFAIFYNQARHLQAKKGNWKKYEFAERNYWLIDLATKFAITLVLIIGLFTV